MAADKGSKTDWLKEHLLYELLMLRYTFAQLTTLRFQLDWNSYFEAFAVHARNLAAFFTNDGGANNFKASDFVSEFRARKGAAQGALNDLEQQVFHLGKRRPVDPQEKVYVDRAKVVYDWLESSVASFFKQASEEYLIDLSNTVLANHSLPVVTLVETTATATNSIVVVTSQATLSVKKTPAE